MLVFNGTEFIAATGIDPAHIGLQQSLRTTGDRCRTEDTLLLLRNLTTLDSGRYRCVLADRGPDEPMEQLDFKLDVLGAFS
jgi:hypothetical protein